MVERRMELRGEEAIALWKEGRDEWNHWVSKNLEADVSFEGVDFRAHLPKEKHIRFDGFDFPNGVVSFVHAKFGDGGVSFMDVTFGDSDVYFSYAEFGDGGVSFLGATFGDGGVSFMDVRFGDGHVSFNGTDFGNGRVMFTGAEFGNGHVSFVGAKFGDGDVYFDLATFGVGNVNFYGTKFGDGTISFNHAKFGEGNISFSGVELGTGTFSAQDTSAKGRFTFTTSASNEQTSIKSLSFRHSRFDDVVMLEGRYTCIPDLRSTITSGHIDLQNLSVEPWTPDGKWPLHRFCQDPDSVVPAFRRLKELAESNRHHDAALRFFADERRAMRWNPKHLGAGASLLEWTYDLLSRYGQSIWRPVLGLIATIVLFAFAYAAYSHYQLPALELMVKAGSASVSNSIPFIPAAFDVRRSALEGLFGVGAAIPLGVEILRLVQGVLGFLFLFLIGLGLRNRFRM